MWPDAGALYLLLVNKSAGGSVSNEQRLISDE